MSTIDSVGDGSLSLRPPVTIHAPCMWADTFSNFSLDDQVQQKYAEEIDALKEEARRRLNKATATPLKQMIIFIDTLERLALAYHFHTEIEQRLPQIYNTTAGEDCDLFTTALRFRLLRQHHYPISCNVFEKFVDKDGRFKETLSSDVEGLLSLYDAAHVRFHDEKILQEAERFTRHELSCMESLLLESAMKEKVKRAMEHPLHREVPFFHARIFISIYERDDSRDELLLKLAKINFNFLQNLYRNELSHLSKWWNKFDLKSKLPYARDRVVEAYFWGAGYHYEPQYSYARIGVAKALILATIIDDTYDNYATLNEAQLLTHVLDRWNMNGIDELPDYMKTVYQFIMSIFEDYESDAAKQEKQFAVPYLKETVQELARAYNQELKWVMGRQMPSFQDYAQNSKAPSCLYLIFASTIPGLKSVTKETINWIKTDPKIVLSTAMIGRFWNDIGSSERENKGGEMLTAVDCYMKQYGISKQETLSKFAKEIEDKWKDVNEEWTAMADVPKEAIFAQLLGYARMSEATYNKYDGDGFTDPSISQAQIASLFVDHC